MDSDQQPAEAKPPKRLSKWGKGWRVFKWSVRGILLAIVAYVVCLAAMISCMPRKSYRGPLPALTDAEATLRDELKGDVYKLAGEIGERNVYEPEKLAEAADWIEAEFQAAGYSVERYTYELLRVPCHNLIVEIRGSDRPDEILVVGAHYDSVPGCPAANDNGSAVAATLALARRFADRKPARTVRFVAFVNEEPPFFWTEDMGSLRYAKRCKASGEKIFGMISLETMGYYSDERGSQHYPPPFNLLYPSTGNFIAFVGNLKSRSFVRDVVGTFRTHTKFPSEGAAMPGLIQQAGWSDHWSFWQAGYPALMVTDTAPFRYPHYHAPEDTPEKLDYERLARVVAGLERTIEDMLNRGGR
jgi:hypothetical protein